MPAPKQLEWVEVPYLWNTYLGIDRNCWEVTSHALNAHGYGICKPSSHGGEGKLHRYVYAQSHIGEEMPDVVMHLCDNPSCVNPTHLVGGTQADNNKDCCDKGRRNPLSAAAVEALRTNLVVAVAARRMFDAQQVREIRARNAAGESQYSLAAAFGTGQSTIWKITSRKSYAHVE
jgi:hypothetical protein